MRTLRWLLCAALAAAPLLAAPTRAEAAVVERIVAVVGEKAILLSDLRQRARPFLGRIHAEVPPGAQRAAATSQLYKALLERMVEEELQARAAVKARITVTSREVDEAMARIARQNKVSLSELLAEATRTGMGARQYRDEVRRQVLEAKLLALRVQGRVRITEEDLHAAYREVVLDERTKLGFRAAWIVLPAPAPGTVGGRALAEQLAARVAHGEDFAALARRHSVDPATREAGGSLGWLRPGKLGPALDKAARALEVGEVSAPLRVGDKLVLLRVLEREASELPTFEEARNQLAERVYMEKMAKARKAWLDGLRRRTHVEVRL